MAYSVSETDHPTDRYAEYKNRVLTLVFGDKFGLLLFVSSLAFFGLFWRVGFFITDNYTVANGLYNAANGHLLVTDIVYGPPSGETPGMIAGDGGRYSRTVGHIVLTLPVMWALEALTSVADLRVVLTGLWSSAILATGVVLGRVLKKESLGRTAGAVVAAVVFVSNIAVATHLDGRWLAHLSLQITSMLAAALTSVLIYRLVSRTHTTRAGVAAGLVVILATPVGFWATIPKRHALIALCVVTTVYSFYLSRETTDSEKSLRFRALSYVFVGLATWVHAADAFILFVSLLVVDLLTASSNSRRELTVVFGAFGLSLVPFFVTNSVVTGNPLLPPRFMPGYEATEVVSTGGGAESSSSTGGSGASGQSTSSSSSNGATGDGTTEAGSASSPESVFAPVFTAVQAASLTVAELGSILVRHLSRTAERATDTHRLTATFVRAGYIESVARKDFGQSANLSMLEAMPVFAAVVLLPKAAVRRVRAHGRDALSATDLLVAVYAVVLTLMYLPRLPLHASITVRYLLPAMPLFVYTVFRFTESRELLQYPRALGFSYFGTVVIGTQLLLTYALMLEASIGEAMQIHALFNLVAAACLAVWVLFHSFVSEQARPVGAVVLGCVCGLTTSFLLLSGTMYLATDSGYVLPLIDWLNAQLSWL
ncbi:hypothetical protein AUR64_14245 [Haloprofundus marisrubri]|uniref:Uncharacterized protein n=1 Tax=Haloprofundus marisrubri TaxID=1514971 RepID=A0A0W1R7Y7_9EURY|nr:hypothetical protein [Haloprofundus marisrubri]KTG08965.1 hypothetical protein AUR64_14245 [Haloprofundus marisrubri]